MMKKLSAAAGLLVLGLASTGASAQSFIPDLFGGATASTQAKLPGNNRYDPYGVTSTSRADVAVSNGGYAVQRRLNAAHNRYDPDGLNGAAYASNVSYPGAGYALPHNAAHNRYNNN